MRSCEECGADLTGRSTRTRFCGASCRSKAHRSPQATTVPAEGEPLEVGILTAVTLNALVDAGRERTPAGVHALLLASRMDSAAETGAAVASLSKQYDVIYARALEGVARVVDPMDELMAQRVKRAAG